MLDQTCAAPDRVAMADITDALLHLKVDPNRPDILQPERCLLPDDGNKLCVACHQPE